MIEPHEVWVGMNISVGVNKPRRAKVCGIPFPRDGRWRVKVEFLNGVREEIPLSLIRERYDLKELVKAINEALPPDERVSGETVDRLMKKRGFA